MLKRKFITSGDTLGEKCKNANEQYVGICQGDINGSIFLEECYNRSQENAPDVIRMMFFEETRQGIQEEFAKATELCDLYRFKDIYHKIGRYGVKSFTNALINNLNLK